MFRMGLEQRHVAPLLTQLRRTPDHLILRHWLAPQAADHGDITLAFDRKHMDCRKELLPALVDRSEERALGAHHVTNEVESKHACRRQAFHGEMEEFPRHEV